MKIDVIETFELFENVDWIKNILKFMVIQYAS